jgi:hypothetical protein
MGTCFSKEQDLSAKRPSPSFRPYAMRPLPSDVRQGHRDNRAPDATAQPASEDAAIVRASESVSGSNIIPAPSVDDQDASLHDYIAKATKLLKYLNMDPEPVTKTLQAEEKIALNESVISPFIHPHQLLGHGWECFAEQVELGGYRSSERRRLAIELGFPRWPDHNASVSSIQNYPCTDASGTTIQPSFGEFSAVHNPCAGMILSYLEISPRHKLGQEGEGGRHPRLQYWADITFLIYKHQAAIRGYEITRLKHIFRTSISDPVVRNVVQTVLGPKCPSYLFWDERHAFEAHSWQAKALLGTSVGVGILWLLLRHRELCEKRVKSVSVYGQVASVGHGDELEMDGNRVNLYFELRDLKRAEEGGERVLVPR